MLSEPLVKVIRYVVEPTYDILSCNLITKSTNFPRNINQQYPLCWIEYYKLSPPHCYVVKYFDYPMCNFILSRAYVCFYRSLRNCAIGADGMVAVANALSHCQQVEKLW